MELQNAPCFHGRLWSAGSWLEDPRSRRGVDSCPQDHSGPLSHVIYPSNCVESGVSLLAGRNHQKGQACGFLQTRLMTFPFLKSHETFFSKKKWYKTEAVLNSASLPLTLDPWKPGLHSMVPKCDRHCADTWDAGSKLRDLLGMIFQIYSPAIHPFKWLNDVEASKVVTHILRGTGEVESQVKNITYCICMITGKRRSRLSFHDFVAVPMGRALRDDILNPAIPLGSLKKRRQGMTLSFFCRERCLKIASLSTSSINIISF